MAWPRGAPWGARRGQRQGPEEHWAPSKTRNRATRRPRETADSSPPLDCLQRLRLVRFLVWGGGAHWCGFVSSLARRGAQVSSTLGSRQDKHVPSFDLFAYTQKKITSKILLLDRLASHREILRDLVQKLDLPGGGQVDPDSSGNSKGLVLFNRSARSPLGLPRCGQMPERMPGIHKKAPQLTTEKEHRWL